MSDNVVQPLSGFFGLDMVWRVESFGGSSYILHWEFFSQNNNNNNFLNTSGWQETEI